MVVDRGELEAAVRDVARGCIGCPRPKSSCAACGRAVCAAIVRRMDERPAPGEPRRPGRSSGIPDVSNSAAVRRRGKSAYPDGCPCKACEACDARGACRRYTQKVRGCDEYTAWRDGELKRLGYGV